MKKPGAQESKRWRLERVIIVMCSDIDDDDDDKHIHNNNHLTTSHLTVDLLLYARI